MPQRMTSNEQRKRDIYDRYGKDGLSGSAGAGERSADTDFPGYKFSFRSADEVFREFFRGRDPFAEFFEDFDPFLEQSRGRTRRQPPNPFSSFSFPDHSGFSSFISFGNTGGMGIGNNFRSVSTSTKFINGKRITTKRIIENEQERIEVEEDGQLKSIKVNGVEDELALGLELSRREQLSMKNNSAQSTPLSRSQSAGPPYYFIDSDDEDEDLQLAMAYSMSEKEAEEQQRSERLMDAWTLPSEGNEDKNKWCRNFKRKEKNTGAYLKSKKMKAKLWSLPAIIFYVTKLSI